MSTTQEDSFREIQLSGKQLVFLFMAVIVIVVAVFLLGLQVGRGVLLARGAPGAESSIAGANAAEPPPPPASASAGSSSSPATAGEKLSYAERLGSAQPPKDSLKAEAAPAPPETAPSPKAEAVPDTAPEPATKPAAKPAAPTTKPTAKTVPAAPAAAASANTASTEPAGAGFAIQVAALRERAEADTIVKRLASKGYPAYVVTPPNGTPTVYRVRVGKFKERSEADSVAARLQKEEQFKPWIVR